MYISSKFKCQLSFNWHIKLSQVCASQSRFPTWITSIATGIPFFFFHYCLHWVILFLIFWFDGIFCIVAFTTDINISFHMLWQIWKTYYYFFLIYLFLSSKCMSIKWNKLDELSVTMEIMLLCITCRTLYCC
jgi:hypothetical protein